MTMKIRMSLNALNEALDWVSIVKPSVTNGVHAAYLFTVSDGRCYLHSKNNEYLRVEVPTISMDNAEEGSGFVYPSERVAALKHVDGWIDIESVIEDKAFRVKYKTQGGANASRVCFDPQLINTDEGKLAQAGEEAIYPTILLREGLGVVAPSLADKQVEKDSNSSLRTIQIFNGSTPETAKGNGSMYATDKQQSCYFFSEELKDKGLTVHDSHLGHLQTFLAKCKSRVKVKVTESMTFVIDQVPGEDGKVRDGAVFGLGHTQNKHTRYKYYSLKLDKFVLSVPRDIVLNSLEYVKHELNDSNLPKVRVYYANDHLKFVGGTSKEVVESAEVPVRALPLEDGTPSLPEFSVNANVKHLIGLFQAARVNEVKFRVAPNDADGRQELYFRTVEDFYLGDSGKIYINPKDAQEPCYGCWVTRFTTTMAD
jgi:hypothetical protein